MHVGMVVRAACSLISPQESLRAHSWRKVLVPSREFRACQARRRSIAIVEKDNLARKSSGCADCFVSLSPQREKLPTVVSRKLVKGIRR